MDPLEERFAKLGVDNAPGQEVRQENETLELRGEPLPGTPVDFSHGDVDAFEPIPGSLDEFVAGVHSGGAQAYTEYRGKEAVRDDLARKISAFTGTEISADSQLIITPGTQGALFLAMGSLIGHGDKVAIVEPDYFANRKIAQFLDADVVPVFMDHFAPETRAGIDLTRLEAVFRDGVKLFLFSNPNNPIGAIYSPAEISAIASLAKQYGVAVIADQLYSRQVFEKRTYVHLCAAAEQPEQVITIMGPSKTESLSGYRLGVAFGSEQIITRMEKLQAIVSLRAGGYSQAVLSSWFNEPDGWMEERITAHQRIRDDLLALLNQAEGMKARATEAGSYLFVTIPELVVPIEHFVKILRIQANVTVTPGTEFGSRFTREFRINFSQDHAAAVDAMKRTINLIERYRR